MEPMEPMEPKGPFYGLAMRESPQISRFFGLKIWLLVLLYRAFSSSAITIHH
jgi:hypothetical protein